MTWRRAAPTPASSATSTTVRPMPPDDLEVDAGIALISVDLADHEHRHVDAALLQRARHDEAVAAVVAFAADERRAARRARR